MSKKPFDPFGQSTYSRWIDDIQRASRVESDWGSLKSLTSAVPDWAKSGGSLASSLLDDFNAALRPKLFDAVPDLSRSLANLGDRAESYFSTISYAEDALRKAGLIDLQHLSGLGNSLSTREMARTQKLFESMSSLGDVERLMSAHDSISLGSHALNLVPDGTLTGALGIAEQVRNAVKAFSSASLGDSLLRAVEGIDFDSIQDAISAATERLAIAAEDLDEPATFEEVHEAIDQAQLEVITQVIVDAVTRAVRDAVEKEQIRGARLQWIILSLTTLAGLIFTAAQIIGSQPFFQTWLEKKLSKEPTQVIKTPSTGIVKKADSGNSTKSNSTHPLKKNNEILVLLASVNLRTGPQTTQRILTKVPIGHLVRLRKAKNNWLLVEYIDSEGDGVLIVGWLQKRYTRPLETETRRLILCALTADHESEDDCEE